ncbi:hypothetical protein OA107_03400 [Candidatus Pelagibacter sp.]|nr:hypothetical protein [Candidatus Pelagibacter sp.]
MNITLVPSDNGLGHIKRIAFLANYLSKFFKVNLIASKKNLASFFIDKKIKIINTKLNLSVQQNRYNFSWYNFLSKKIINKTDLFVCDNLPEIYKLNKKSLVFANFFWHHILKINKKKKQELNDLIKNSNKPVICNYLFASKQIKKKYKIKKIGFFGNFKGRKKKFIKNILISIGTAKLNYLTKKKINKEIMDFFESVDDKGINFFVDPLIELKKNKHIKCKIHKANFSSNMYRKIDLAIIKPGLGTINDCLQNAIPIVTLSKPFNKEFKFNALILKKNNLGFDISSFRLINKILAIIKNDNNFFSKYFLRCKKLQWNGEKQFYRLIKYSNF